MTKTQITELLAELKADAAKEDLEIDESFIKQLRALKREGQEQIADPKILTERLDSLAREALVVASRSGKARIRARDLMTAYARNDDPWKLP